jgi:hypothetical protein
MITSEQIRGARAMLGMEQSELAEWRKFPSNRSSALRNSLGQFRFRQERSTQSKRRLSPQASSSSISMGGRPLGWLARRSRRPSPMRRLPEIPKGAADDYDGSPM